MVNGMRQYGRRVSYDVHEIDDAVLTASEKEAARLAFRFDQRWLIAMWVVMMCIVCALLGRIFYLTVVRGNYYAFVASGNSLRETPILAPRGIMYDIGGEKLVDNVPGRDVVVVPEALPAATDDDRALAARIAPIVGVSEDAVYDSIANARTSMEQIVVAQNISHEQTVAFKARAAEFPAMRIQQAAMRTYTDGPVFAHIIGYEGLIKKEEREQHPDYLLTDRIGKTGLEASHERDLHGTHGMQRILVDSKGELVKDLGDVRPMNGKDLHLTIDAGLQRVLYERLTRELDRAKTRRAAAVAIDPRSGAVRALVSLPSYDNNIFAAGISSAAYAELINNADRPLFNRAIGGAYAPGSTIKPSMALAALAENIITPQRTIESRGGLQIGSFFFGDWRVHGFTDMRRAIAVSSDVYFYTIGGGYGDIAGLGIDRMKTYMTRFGYGAKTGIDLPGEVGGFYPDAAWKQDAIGERWYIGNTYHASIGQGYITATPLQVAHAITLIASGGTLYTPHLVAWTQDPTTGERTETVPQVIGEHLASPAHLRVAQEGMRATITEGTATMLKNLPVAVAGKTGTAQFGGSDNVHSWFVAYAPYDAPELVLVVMVEGQTGELSSTTVPVAHDALLWYFGGRGATTVSAPDGSSPEEITPIGTAIGR